MTIMLELPNVEGFLSFTRLDKFTFEVEVSNSGFSGKANVTNNVVGSPAILFKEIAANWRGWDGEKTWVDLEGYCTLTAKMNSFGHLLLGVQLIDFTFDNKVSVVCMFESGQLDSMATRMKKLF